MSSWLAQHPMFQAVYLDIRRAINQTKGGEGEESEDVAAFNSAQAIVDRYREFEYTNLQAEEQKLKIKWGMPYMSGGLEGRYEEPEWQASWPLPSIGQSVYLSDRKFLVVRAIDWHPYGGDDPEPFVYIVLNEHRIGARYT